MLPLRAALAAALLCLSSLATAQSGPPSYTPMANGDSHTSVPAYTYCWSGTAWVGCSPSGSGGGGGAVTVADGADITLGSKADGPASAFDTTANSLIALSKAEAAYLQALAKAASDNTTAQPVSITDGADQTLGSKADPKSTATDTTAVSEIALLKGLISVSKPASSFAPMTVGSTYTPGIGVGASCTAAGNVVFQGGDGSQITVPVLQGYNQFAFAVAKVVSAGTTATCTYTSLS